MQTKLTVSQVIPAKSIETRKDDAKDRQRRFCLVMPLQFRVPGKHEWREGTTENISDSGILFRTGLTHEPGTVMEMRIALSVMAKKKCVELHCRGTVVRATPTDNGCEIPGLAVRFSSYRLMRCG